MCKIELQKNLTENEIMYDVTLHKENKSGILIKVKSGKIVCMISFTVYVI